jgi:hypothetical protein
VDPAGYTDIGGNFDVQALFAMRPSGETTPLAVELADLKSGTSFTIYGVGDGDEYPHEVWICPDERASSSPLTDCGLPVDVTIETFATQLSDYFMRDVDQRARRWLRWSRISTPIWSASTRSTSPSTSTRSRPRRRTDTGSALGRPGPHRDGRSHDA